MATAYTSLLGLALPVQGELSGTWGDTVNNAITSLLDTAVAGTTSLTTDADTTLTTTTGASNQARQAIILWNPASGTVTRNITAPAQSKIYTVINASGGTQSIVIRGAGPTTGVTIIKGEAAQVAWNGSDFVKISSSAGDVTVRNLTVTGNTILGDASTDTVTINGTVTSNLLFTDNTYDIGASGATRPRNLFLAGNATVGGNVTLGDASTDTVTVNGYMSVGGIPNNAIKLYTLQQTAVGVGAYANISQVDANSSNTSLGICYEARPNTAAASFTISNLFGLRVANSVKGAGSTISNLIGVQVQDLTGGDSNFGIQSLVSSGTNKWNIYASGTAQNYFAGNVGVNTTDTTITGNVVGSSSRFVVSGSAGRTQFTDTGNEIAFSRNSANYISANGGTAAGIVTGAQLYLRFDTGSTLTERMRIDAVGNTGIGTSSPSSRLDVADATSAIITLTRTDSTSGNGVIRSIGNTGVTNASINLGGGVNNNMVFNTSGSERMRIDSSGNLLVATTSSTIPHTLTSGSGAMWNNDKYISIARASDSLFLNRIGSNGGVARFYRDGGTDVGSISVTTTSTSYNTSPSSGVIGVDANTVAINTSSTERMRIDSSGNVGIGTASPAAKLQVVGNTVTSNLAFGTATSSAGTLSSDTANSGARIILWGSTSANTGLLELITVPAAPITFATSSAERMRLDASGNLGIGTTTPVARVGVYGTGQTTAAMSTSSGLGSTLYVRDSGAAAGNGGAVMFGANQGAFAAIKGLLSDGANNTSGSLAFSVRPTSTDATLTEAMRITAAGNVGIGTSSPGTKLDVTGGIRSSTTVSSVSSSISDTGIATFGSWTRIQENGFFDAGGNFLHNAIKTSGVNDTWTYVFSGAPVARYKILNGVHSWYNAPSGTAGNAITFTQAMTLDASGNLLVGGTAANFQTSGRGVIEINGTSESLLGFNRAAAISAYIWAASSGFRIINQEATPIIFSTTAIERARITAAGEYLVGLTTATGVAKLQVSGAIRTTGFTVATLPAGTVGMRTYVTDALAPSFSANVVGGGAVTIPVFYNGTNWIVA